MITVRLPEELEARLEALCKEDKRSKNYIMNEALEYFLDDVEAVTEAKKNPNSEYWTFEQATKELGLDECTK